MDILGIDILGGDRPAPGDDLTEQDTAAADGEYDLWDLNCCILRDAYWRGDMLLSDRVLAYLDTWLTPEQ